MTRLVARTLDKRTFLRGVQSLTIVPKAAPDG